MAKRDYYDILGVNREASEEEIKKSYRALAKKYHPDISKEEDAEKKFKEVQEAYDTLGDSQKRANYDRFGHSEQFQGFEGFSDFGGFGGFSDIFDSFFGGTRARQSPNAPQKGNDIERIIEVSFEEATLGSKKNIRVEIDENCHTCGGSGGATKKDVTTCDRCNGAGVVHVEQRSFFGSIRTLQVCP